MATHPDLAPLLRRAHGARLFADSKTLVDMPLRAPPARVAAAFAELEARLGPPPPRGESAAAARALAAFVAEWLAPAGADLRPAPAALTAGLLAPPPPGWLPRVADPGARAWAAHLRRAWASLARAADAGALAAHPDRHTLLPLAGAAFVVPGARFREAYYWDSLWVVQGLLACGAGGAPLAAAVVDGLLGLAEAHGYVPNGARSYYLNRSQPPLLAAMVAALAAHVDARGGDAAPLLRRALPALLAEHAHWASAPKAVAVRDAAGREHRVARYWAAWDAPRPESHREDAATCAAACGGDAAAAARLCRELASAAESGWDFSSRWLADGRSLASARTTRTVPADLNAFLYAAERHVAAFAARLGDAALAARFAAAADARAAAIGALLWDEGAAQWRDLVLAGGEGAPDGAPPPAGGRWRPGGWAPGVFASNWVPLACGLAGEGRGPGAGGAASARAAAAVGSLARSGLLGPGGAAASLAQTGQQWDWPNAWPPLQALLAEGCAAAGGDAGAALGRRVAGAFLRAARAGWEATGGAAAGGRMYEKYDARSPGGVPGGGGEYEVCDGFGWTNGAALALMERFGWVDDEGGGGGGEG